MVYHDELLAPALELVHLSPPTQVTLRRAVSSAYYAVFHLLIFEATSNWAHATLRPSLGRAYEHGTMKTASNRVLDTTKFPFAGEDATVVARLRFVAQTFSQLQEDRHFADYNFSADLDSADAITQVKSGEDIFTTWPSIRGQQIAQAYLVSLLVKRV
jgi:hypothetical protein